MRAAALVAVALLACGKKSSPPPAHDEAGVAPTPETAPGPSAAADAAIATAVTPPPPPASGRGHFCAKTASGRSVCATTEQACKQLSPRCGQWKSVFCYATAAGASCFSSREDCKAAHAEAKAAGAQLTSECVQDEM